MRQALQHERPRIGFLGVGWIGRNRLEAVSAGRAAEIAAIGDLSAEACASAAELAPAAAICSFEEMLAMGLAGVVIATPSAQHAQQCIDALSHGLAVFCQKPLARNALETAAIVATARTHDRLLGVDFCYRHVRGVAEMRELIRRGALGDVFSVDLVFHNAYGPDKAWFYDRNLSGGGCLIDLGIHLVDLADYLLDGLAVTHVDGSLFAQGRPAGRHEIEDYVSARLEFVRPGGQRGVASLSCSWRLSAGQDAVIEATIYGTRGAVRLRNVNGSFYDFHAEHLSGTTRTLLSCPPDAWGRRATLYWAEQLTRSPRYDSGVEPVLNVASIVDRIYAS